MANLNDCSNDSWIFLLSVNGPLKSSGRSILPEINTVTKPLPFMGAYLQLGTTGKYLFGNRTGSSMKSDYSQRIIGKAIFIKLERHD